MNWPDFCRVPKGTMQFFPTSSSSCRSAGYVANTQKYVMGPAALTALAPPVSADLVDFGASSEVSLGRYNTSSGEATLMLISYPTPQIAAEHLRALMQRISLTQPQTGVSTVDDSGTFFDKRTGPIVAIATGPDLGQRCEGSLLGMVNYEANVTWQTPTSDPQVRDLYHADSQHRRSVCDSRGARDRGRCCVRWNPYFDEAFVSRSRCLTVRSRWNLSRCTSPKLS